MVMPSIILVMAVSFSARNGASAALEAAGPGPAANTAQDTALRKVRAMTAKLERVIERALEGMAHIPVAIRSMQSTPE